MRIHSILVGAALGVLSVSSVCADDVEDMMYTKWEAVMDTARLQEVLEQHSSLKDPFSVRFRKVSTRMWKASDAHFPIWCGELNAKNEHGAYAGWVEFSVTEAPRGNFVIQFGGQGGTEVGRKMVELHCQGSLIRPKRSQ